MLRSVDMQQVLLHSNVVEKVQQVQQQHAEVERKNFALQFQEEIEQRKKEVQDTKESEELQIREEERRKRQRQETMSEQEKAEGDTPLPRKETVIEVEQGKILDLKV
jgi:methionine-rich copper-binding protein CopC